MINFSHKILERMTQIIFAVALLAAGEHMISAAKADGCDTLGKCYAKCDDSSGAKRGCRNNCERTARGSGVDVENCKR